MQKKVYGAESEEIALRNLESMQEDWKKYGAVLDSFMRGIEAMAAGLVKEYASVLEEKILIH